MHCTALDFHLWVRSRAGQQQQSQDQCLVPGGLFLVHICSTASLSPMTMYYQVGRFWQFFKPNSMKLSMVTYTLTENCWIEFKVQNPITGPRISYYKCHIYYVFLLSPPRLLFGLMPLLVCCHRQRSGNPAQKLIFWHVSLMIMQLVQINLNQGPTKKNLAVLF